MNTAQISKSGVPLTGRATRELVQVIADLVAVRPTNWDGSTDPQQRAAWRAAEAALAHYGASHHGG